jgi:hypothetical protein
VSKNVFDAMSFPKTPPDASSYTVTSPIKKKKSATSLILLCGKVDLVGRVVAAIGSLFAGARA